MSRIDHLTGNTRTRDDGAVQVRHTLRLEGKAANGARISLRTLADIANLLNKASKRVLQLRLEGQTSLKDTHWLDPATEIELVGLENGSTVLELDVPLIDSALRNHYAQQSLFGLDDAIPPQATAFSFLEEALRDAVSGKTDSEYLDHTVLESVLAFRKIFALGFDAFTLNGTSDQPPVRVTQQEMTVVAQMRAVAASPQRVVVSGYLDSIVASRRAFVLLVSDEAKSLRGILPQNQNSKDFVRFVGDRVTVDGEASFRPSGAVLRIQATNIARATEADKAFERAPRPAPASLNDLRPRNSVPLGTNSLSRVIGAWPGDETDEEIIAALEELDD